MAHLESRRTEISGSKEGIKCNETGVVLVGPERHCNDNKTMSYNNYYKILIRTQKYGILKLEDG